MKLLSTIATSLAVLFLLGTIVGFAEAYYTKYSGSWSDPANRSISGVTKGKADRIRDRIRDCTSPRNKASKVNEVMEGSIDIEYEGLEVEIPEEWELPISGTVTVGSASLHMEWDAGKENKIVTPSARYNYCIRTGNAIAVITLEGLSFEGVSVDMTIEMGIESGIISLHGKGDPGDLNNANVFIRAKSVTITSVEIASEEGTLALGELPSLKYAMVKIKDGKIQFLKIVPTQALLAPPNPGARHTTFARIRSGQ